ncbi:MAG: hypothetical protein V3U60_04595, partial [Gammaproteobacteria bacterium]
IVEFVGGTMRIMWFVRTLLSCHSMASTTLPMIPCSCPEQGTSNVPRRAGPAFAMDGLQPDQPFQITVPGLT